MKALRWGAGLAVIVAVAVWLVSRMGLANYGSVGTFEQTLGLFDTKAQKPLADTAFYLVIIKNSEDDPVFKKPLFGKTDSEGRAAKVFSKVPLNEGDYILVERIGNGNFGQTFQLKKAGVTLPTTSYTLSGCNGVPEYKGVSDKQGYTVYYSTPEVCNIKLDIDWSNTLNNLGNVVGDSIDNLLK